MRRMQRLRNVVAAAALVMALGRPLLAEANGEHVHVGELHFDPLVGTGVAIFVGLITLMFVGQWVRVNAARQRGEGPTNLKESFEQEEAENDFERGREEQG